jgi:glycosyltransferase involved in cell wall biosynthesis
MRLLMITFVYNEIKYLPHVIDYYRSQGCEIYIIDNYSNDGTWEWLQENNIPSHRCDTNEEFAVETLQRDLEKTVHQLKPDWVMFAGADLYFIVEGTLQEYIQYIDKEGYNLLSLLCLTPLNTGEPYGLPLCKCYFFSAIYRNVPMISKYTPEWTIIGDDIQLSEPRMIIGEGVAVNYGGCKTKEEQEAKLQRTIKAWENGTTRKNHSVHYPKWKKKEWIFDKEGLIDLRESEYYKYIKKIC